MRGTCVKGWAFHENDKSSQEGGQASGSNLINAGSFCSIPCRYNYVLFTDADVYFKRRITLDDFGA